MKQYYLHAAVISGAAAAICAIHIIMYHILIYRDASYREVHSPTSRHLESAVDSFQTTLWRLGNTGWQSMPQFIVVQLVHESQMVDYEE